ncbi:MAG: helix-turn-helix transcriptional regulator [Aquisalimonadaceae bacterium]
MRNGLHGSAPLLQQSRIPESGLSGLIELFDFIDTCTRARSWQQLNGALELLGRSLLFTRLSLGPCRLQCQYTTCCGSNSSHTDDQAPSACTSEADATGQDSLKCHLFSLCDDDSAGEDLDCTGIGPERGSSPECCRERCPDDAWCFLRRSADEDAEVALSFWHRYLKPHIQLARQRITITDDGIPKVGKEPVPELTSRETEALRWLTLGKNNWEIARILGISERTVKFHLRNAFTKLDVNNRTQAAAKAQLLGLIVATA